jgi:hypothetical protein
MIANTDMYFTDIMLSEVSNEILKAALLDLDCSTALNLIEKDH